MPRISWEMLRALLVRQSRRRPPAGHRVSTFEPLEARRLLASVAGHVFKDLTGSPGADPGLGGWTVPNP